MNIKIPSEALDAALKSYENSTRYTTAKRIEDAIRAALAAWPGKDTKDGSDYWVPQIIILPLPQETSE